MNLSELQPKNGSRQGSTRVGRGHGAGSGKTAGRGHKGQKARSGGSVRLGFEGGQMPLFRRLPKRGIKKKTHRNFTTIVSFNLDRLNIFENGTEVTVALLKESGIISNPRDGVKILGNGTLTKKLNIKGCAYSASAKAQIEALGGKAE